MADAMSLNVPEVAEPFSWEERSGVPCLEAGLPGARAAFTTRVGGVSDGPYRSLNLGILTDDDRARVMRNRERVVESLGRDSEGVAMGLQVHGARVEVRERTGGGSAYSHPGTALQEADAQVTGSPEVTPLVLVADCVPLVLAGPGAVGAVHCGWRGVLAGVVERAVEAVGRLARQQQISAAIGPGIAACCYEVGEDVRRAFRDAGHGDDVLPAGRLELAVAVRRTLERLGVPAHRIATAGLCTSCHPELFFSHRRDGGVTGRQGGLAWLDI
jgi:YfiH family protein